MTDANPETNQAESTPETNQVDVSSVVEALKKHASLMTSLSEKPGEVNSEGLKHLGEQAKSMALQVESLTKKIDEKTKTESDALLQVSELKLELAKRDAMAKYGFTDEDMDLFVNLKSVEDINSFAGKLSEKLKSNAPKPRFNVSNEAKEVKVAEHLQHLLP